MWYILSSVIGGAAGGALALMACLWAVSGED